MEPIGRAGFPEGLRQVRRGQLADRGRERGHDREGAVWRCFKMVQLTDNSLT